MAPGRKVLFIVYAIASYIYRWVITFSIIFFLSGFLGPQLKILSQDAGHLCICLDVHLAHVSDGEKYQTTGAFA